MNEAVSERVTAAMVVIGDEILSGRTKDVNVGFLAETLTALGIDLCEVRMVSDEEAAIVEAINTLRARNSYVFTSGGIGPTHDDITADSVSAAFGVPCTHHPKAFADMAADYEARGMEFTQARQRMARTPEGARLIENGVSKAPGFVIGNVHVMAGVPRVFQAMVGAVAPTLRTGVPIVSRTVDCPFGEGDIGEPLAAIQKDSPDVAIGSYPRWEDGRFSTQLVVRGRDPAAVERTVEAVRAMVDGLVRAG